jgi:hypothetical protein
MSNHDAEMITPAICGFIESLVTDSDDVRLALAACSVEAGVLYVCEAQRSQITRANEIVMRVGSLKGVMRGDVHRERGAAQL